MTRPRSRRSIAHIPRKTSSGLDKENATTDIGAIGAGLSNGKALSRDKKSRSKSLGPGGLDALQDSNGNRRKVNDSPIKYHYALITDCFLPSLLHFLSNPFLNPPSLFPLSGRFHPSKNRASELPVAVPPPAN
jgi:hypothetical protein